MAEQPQFGKTQSTAWRASQPNWPLHHHLLSVSPDNRTHKFLDYAIEIIKKRHPYVHRDFDQYIYQWKNCNYLLCHVMAYRDQWNVWSGGDERDLLILEMKRDSSDGESKKRWSLTSWDFDDAQCVHFLVPEQMWDYNRHTWCRTRQPSPCFWSLWHTNGSEDYAAQAQTRSDHEVCIRPVEGTFL